MKHNVSLKLVTAIIGLGNPGPKFAFTPHNIGFLVLDQMCDTYSNGTWQEKKNMLICNIDINDRQLTLVKPQTFMNNSGEVLSHLKKDGIKQENILTIHDEIDYKFGKVNFKDGGSARGHNGLRSIIQHGGQNFVRMRVGVGRPEDRHQVGNFVTAPFQESDQQVQELIDQSIQLFIDHLPKPE